MRRANGAKSSPVPQSYGKTANKTVEEKSVKQAEPAFAKSVKVKDELYSEYPEQPKESHNGLIFEPREQFAQCDVRPIKYEMCGPEISESQILPGITTEAQEFAPVIRPIARPVEELEDFTRQPQDPVFPKEMPIRTIIPYVLAVQTELGPQTKPDAPPPPDIPLKPISAQRVSGDAMKPCFNRPTYVWMTDGGSFWFYPTYIRSDTLAGWRFTDRGWAYTGLDTGSVDQFTCV